MLLVIAASLAGEHAKKRRVLSVREFFLSDSRCKTTCQSLQRLKSAPGRQKSKFVLRCQRQTLRSEGSANCGWCSPELAIVRSAAQERSDEKAAQHPDGAPARRRRGGFGVQRSNPGECAWHCERILSTSCFSFDMTRPSLRSFMALSPVSCLMSLHRPQTMAEI